MCRGAGVWIADGARAEPRRIDGGQVATPAGAPAVSPDGRRVAMPWNKQLWTLTLDGTDELTQVTRFEQSVSAGAWSPDGTAFAVLLWDVAQVERRDLEQHDPRQVASGGNRPRALKQSGHRGGGPRRIMSR